jgi:hypothetical protein
MKQRRYNCLWQMTPLKVVGRGAEKEDKAAPPSASLPTCPLGLRQYPFASDTTFLSCFYSAPSMFHRFGRATMEDYKASIERLRRNAAQAAPNRGLGY